MTKEKERTNASQNQIVATNAVKKRSQADIFRLNIDCFEKLFDWLAVVDLLCLRQTCKRLKQIADFYIKIKWPAIELGGATFKEISVENVGEYSLLGTDCIDSIKKLNMNLKSMSAAQLRGIKPILSQVGSIKVSDVPTEGMDHEFIQFCDSLKYLSVPNCAKVFENGKNEWIQGRCPTLEHIHIDGNRLVVNDELKTFFELNPNIRTLSTSVHFLAANEQLLRIANMKFDQLNLDGTEYPSAELPELCDLLKRCYKSGFYRRLHLSTAFYPTHEAIVEMASIPPLKKLTLFSIDTELSPLNDLLELDLEFVSETECLNVVAKNLANIERISIKQASFGHIEAFVRHSAKLKHIRVKQLSQYGGTHFRGGIVDLVALDKERQKLSGAFKMKVYVNEGIFLATKWAKSKTNYKWIELKRTQAYR